ncbi:hypothetical protein BABINDRAFT_162830 [Babjeviella inositovora NRRL Y-12698]|uniref:Uncharacterized protein n=1 Tax=Babjeviella inositovora NRRL Y-12698 TaxID=984486 RepID=A0A1E3QME7_9ASCO|nr:uncharacterized protein BABINDRAFT_162830 [Babjeviella inositovora NRRL Y-12698]ODQ78157.1 hypothetical protein BABINDRAFT_162830 [Babjeviella inositovora NRRL Y-12698]
MKQKQTKFMKLEGRLSTKIEQSIERSRSVQTTRKSGWDSINKSIKTENFYLANLFREDGDLVDEDSEDEKVTEKMEEDKYVAEFFGTGAEPVEKLEKYAAPRNAFALLEETEC